MGGFPKLAGAAPAAGLLAACANGVEMAAEGPGATRRTALDEVFTGAKGMTLYTYDEDKPGKSELLRNLRGVLAASRGAGARRAHWQVHRRHPGRQGEAMGSRRPSPLRVHQ